MIRVKICGITRAEDARVAVEAGATHLGFIFAPSPRRVEPETAAAISAAVRPGVERVGVFVNGSAEQILRIARQVGLTMVQLHGEESVDLERRLQDQGLRVLKAIRVADAETAVAEAGARATRGILIEPRVEGKAGGTGRTLPAEVAACIVAALPDREVYLAGGLGPDNVAELVRAARPYAVDASSRLESSPGRKDPALVKRFLEALRDDDDT